MKKASRGWYSWPSPVGCVTAHAAKSLWVSISLFFRAWVRSSAPPRSRPSAPTTRSHQEALRDAPHSWSHRGSVGTMVSHSPESLRTSWDYMIGGMGQWIINSPGMIWGQTEKATEWVLLSGTWNILNCLLKTTSVLGKGWTCLLVDMSSPYDSQFLPNLPNAEPGSCGQLVALQHLKAWALGGCVSLSSTQSICYDICPT